MPVGRSNEIETDRTRGNDWQSWDVNALIGGPDDGRASPVGACATVAPLGWKSEATPAKTLKEVFVYPLQGDWKAVLLGLRRPAHSRYTPAYSGFPKSALPTACDPPSGWLQWKPKEEPSM